MLGLALPLWGCSTDGKQASDEPWQEPRPDASSAPGADGAVDIEDPDAGAVAGDDSGTELDAGDVADTGGPVARCPVPAVVRAGVRSALESGDALAAPDSDALIEATLATLEAQRTQFDVDLAQLFGLDAAGNPTSTSLTAITWDPRHDSAQLSASFGINVEALISNDAADASARDKVRALAVLGRRPGPKAGRYLALATNPFRTDPKRDNASVVNSQLDQFLLHALSWLTQKSDLSQLKLVLAQLDESTWFADESSTRAWFTARLGTQLMLNDPDTCDGQALSSCLSGADLLIISQHSDPAAQATAPIVAAVESALESGIPVLYVHRDGGITPLGQSLLDLLQVKYEADNAGDKLRISDLDGASVLGRLPARYVSIKETLTRLTSGNYDFTLANHADDAHRAVYQAQFAEGAGAVKDMMNGYDQRAQDLFQQCGNEVPKLLALLGDRLRQDIRYPMQTASANVRSFLRAYFADHAVYNVRAQSPAQPDRGTFDRKDLSQVAGATKEVALISRRDFRSAGVYALPGRALRVTRTDQNAVKTWVFVNPLRSGSTHEWDDDYYSGFSRPKFLQSAHVPLAPGQTITLTNPYGGPVQVRFDAGDVAVQLRFENVGEHPHWSGSEDDASFASKYAAGLYDWVEIATDGFELHAKTDKFAGTMKDARWNTPAKLAAVVEQYTFNYVHVLAGIQGRGIDKHPEIHDWATQKGLTLPTLDLVKHANMDQATCGNGCSGNPYDADWSFNPIGHGDLHELGHSLQNGRFQLGHGAYTYANHAVTNWSPFYGAARYFDDHGGSTSDWGVSHKAIFNQLQAAYKAGERTGAFSQHMDAYFSGILAQGGDSGIGDNYSFFMQAMLMARHKQKLSNGYHIVPRVHLVERAFREALKSPDTWNAQRSGLGFGQLSLEQAKVISNNEFMLIAMSFVTGLDYSDFFAMWGLAVGAPAKAQVESYGYPK
ncbi:MAG TPA: ImpA family metalloprotease, partial [Polyangiales bacterium]